MNLSEAIDNTIDADRRNDFTSYKKEKAYLNSQAFMSANRNAEVVATDDTTTQGVTYMQYYDGKIKKWTTETDATGTYKARYIASAGTTWEERVTAIYTKDALGVGGGE